MTRWFAQPLTTLAFCWRLQRRDGIVLGFTSHDRDLELGGLRYRASPGLVPSAIELRDGLDAETMEIGGALTSDLITDGDLEAGRWDGAALCLFAVDWQSPDSDPLYLARGQLGSIENDGRAFTASLLGPAHLLDRPIVETTSPECRATLGDRRCRVDLSGRRRIARVGQAEGARVILRNAILEPGLYAFGHLRWLDGANAGLCADVATSDEQSVTLLDRPPVRPLAYAVFEDLALGDFGNRIPSLSFEVIADQGDVSLGEVLKVVAAGGMEADCSQSVHGIAVTGDSVRGLVETLQPLFPVHVSDDGARLLIHEDLSAGGAIWSADLGASPDGQASPPVQRLRSPAVKETNILSVAHYEPERDHQQGLQRVRRAGDGNREERIDMPVAISAGALRMFAGAALSRRREERRRASVRLPWSALDLRPASLVTLPEDETQWRVVGVSVDRMVVEADLVAHSSGPRLAAIADAGSGMLQPDRPQGPTTVQLIDLPPLGQDAASAPRIAVAAAGVEPGWKTASLLVSTDGGASWQEAGSTAAPAILGHALNALAPGSCRIEDRVSTVDIALLNRDMALHNAGLDALLAGANAAMLGREIIQFAQAVQTGPASFRLSGLLRGRRGTEWAVGEHVSGESFVLLDPDTLALIEVPVGASEVRLLAKGAGDNVPVEAALPIFSEAIRPLPPVQLRLTHGEGGNLYVHWIRRSRTGWDWLDGVDAPLSEENEVYHVSMVPDVGPAFTETVGTASLVIPASRLAAFQAAGATRLALSVRQLGKLAQSRETTIDIMLETQGH